VYTLTKKIQMYGPTIDTDVLIENHIDIDNDIDTNISHHL
jgi:hypothetical protein